MQTGVDAVSLFRLYKSLVQLVIVHKLVYFALKQCGMALYMVCNPVVLISVSPVFLRALIYQHSVPNCFSHIQFTSLISMQ